IAGSGGSLFLRKGLVTAQVALSFLLLFGAGLFVKSLQNLRTTDPGVALDNLISFQLSPSLSGYTETRAGQFNQELLARLRPTPGVTSAASGAVRVRAGDGWDKRSGLEGHAPPAGGGMQALMSAFSPG